MPIVLVFLDLALCPNTDRQVRDPLSNPQPFSFKRTDVQVLEPVSEGVNVPFSFPILEKLVK